MGLIKAQANSFQLFSVVGLAAIAFRPHSAAVSRKPLQKAHQP